MNDFEEMKAKIEYFDKNLNQKDKIIEEFREENLKYKANIQEDEREHLETVKELKQEIENIKESNHNVVKLYEYQNEAFKDRVSKELEYLQQNSQNSDLKESSHDYSGLLNDLAQRDAV